MEVETWGVEHQIGRRRCGGFGYLKTAAHQQSLQSLGTAGGISDPAERELAFQCCAKVAGADGAYVVQEALVIRLLREIWELSAEDVERLLVLASR